MLNSTITHPFSAKHIKMCSNFRSDAFIEMYYNNRLPALIDDESIHELLDDIWKLKDPRMSYHLECLEQAGELEILRNPMRIDSFSYRFSLNNYLVPIEHEAAFSNGGKYYSAYRLLAIINPLFFQLALSGKDVDTPRSEIAKLSTWESDNFTILDEFNLPDQFIDLLSKLGTRYRSFREPYLGYKVANAYPKPPAHYEQVLQGHKFIDDTLGIRPLPVVVEPVTEEVVKPVEPLAGANAEPPTEPYTPLVIVSNTLDDAPHLFQVPLTERDPVAENSGWIAACIARKNRIAEAKKVWDDARDEKAKVVYEIGVKVSEARNAYHLAKTEPVPVRTK